MGPTWGPSGYAAEGERAKGIGVNNQENLRASLRQLKFVTPTLRIKHENQLGEKKRETSAITTLSGCCCP